MEHSVPQLAARLLQCLMVPAYVANMAPPFVRYWKGPSMRARALGDHKTVVGRSPTWRIRHIGGHGKRVHGSFTCPPRTIAVTLTSAGGLLIRHAIDASQ